MMRENEALRRLNAIKLLSGHKISNITIFYLKICDKDVILNKSLCGDVLNWKEKS
jgi:hypothetical protein